MQILIWVMMIVGGAAGLLSTAYLVLAMPIILVWKIFRKVKFCEEADYSMNNQKNPIGILSNWMEMKL